MTATIIALPPRTLPSAAVPSAGTLPAIQDAIHLRRAADLVRKLASDVRCTDADTEALTWFATMLGSMAAGHTEEAIRCARWAGRRG